MAIRKKVITPAAKAKELVDKYGAVVAQEVADGILTEIQELGWNQVKIDYYLDVKNGINIIAEYLAKKVE